jgi:hypothetical protein
MKRIRKRRNSEDLVDTEETENSEDLVDTEERENSEEQNLLSVLNLQVIIPSLHKMLYITCGSRVNCIRYRIFSPLHDIITDFDCISIRYILVLSFY